MSLAELQMAAASVPDTALRGRASVVAKTRPRKAVANPVGGERFEDSQKNIREAKTLLLSGKGASRNAPSNLRLMALANLLLAETLLDQDHEEAVRFATEAESQIKDVKDPGHEEYFRMSVIYAILGRKEKAKVDLDVAVQRGNKCVRRYQVHRTLGLRTIVESPADVKHFDELLRQMQIDE